MKRHNYCSVIIITDMLYKRKQQYDSFELDQLTLDGLFIIYTLLQQQFKERNTHPIKVS